VLVTQAVPDVEERSQSHRDAGQEPAQGDLADFDAAADLDFLPCCEQGDLTDFLEIEADRILAPCGQRRECLFRNRLRGLRLVFDQRRVLDRLLRRHRRRHRVVGLGLLIALPECHGVTQKNPAHA